MTTTAPAAEASPTGALYNRYRPRRLSELVGQDHVAVPLQRAFDKGRIHHAYLLSGPRGCGKTSTARILAAGLVCETGPTGEPCGTCAQCLAVIAGNHIDVTELDAASNGGVDDARDLREKAYFAPAMARYKVIVVDEAHMVSAGGFNALLKLIEEPPAHVRFIFATTNPEKVLGTIRSRTYHYAFRLVSAPVLAAHLATVAATEGATLDDGVLPLVVRAAGGSMRDALSILGQLLDGSAGTQVSLEDATTFLGATSQALIDSILAAIADQDAAAALTRTGDALDTGIEPLSLLGDLLDRMRDFLLFAATGQVPALAGLADAETTATWQSLARQLGVPGWTVGCETFLASLANLHSGQPRISLETAVARTILALTDAPRTATAAPAATPGTESTQIAGLVAELRQMLSQQTAVAPAPTAPAAPAMASATSQPGPAHTGPAHTGPAQNGPATATGSPDVDAAWARILDLVASRRRATWTLLSANTRPARIADGIIHLTVAHPGIVAALDQPGHRDLITAAATDVYGGTWTVQAHLGAQS